MFVLPPGLILSLKKDDGQYEMFDWIIETHPEGEVNIQQSHK